MQNNSRSGNVRVLVEDGLLHLVGNQNNLALAIVALCATADRSSLGWS